MRPYDIEPRTRAISIRQPYAEAILQGKKRKEFRPVRTWMRGLVWIYASKTPGDDPAMWRKLKAQLGDLETGMIVGTVEIVDCVEEEGGGWAYVLKNPRRCRTWAPHGVAQPIFWRPRRH
jgi:hypothetical protein